jgi:hypothetical protein
MPDEQEEPQCLCGTDQVPPMAFHHEELGGWEFYCARLDFSEPIVVMYPATATKAAAQLRLQKLLVRLRSAGYQLPKPVTVLYNMRAS